MSKSVIILIVLSLAGLIVFAIIQYQKTQQAKIEQQGLIGLTKLNVTPQQSFLGGLFGSAFGTVNNALNKI